MTLLDVRDLRTAYGAIEALHGISFRVDRGEIVALLGANGAGKTTTLRTICGLLAPRGGTVTFDGRRIDGLRAHLLVRLGLTMVPEGRWIFGVMTVEENLRLGGYTRLRNAPVNMERMYGYFPILADRRRQQGGALSGGEQQMLAIARALMMEPRLLVLDEPSFGLAPRVVENIFKIVERIKREERVSVLLVEQNANLALELSDHAYLLETGYVVASGSAKALADDPQIRRAYLGY